MNASLFYGISCLIGLGGMGTSIFIFIYLSNKLPQKLLLQGVYSLVAILYICGGLWLTLITGRYFNPTKVEIERFIGIWIFLELAGLAYVYYDRFRKGQLTIRKKI